MKLYEFQSLRLKRERRREKKGEEKKSQTKPITESVYVTWFVTPPALLFPRIHDFAKSGWRCRRVSCFLREYRRRVICTRVITRIIPRIGFHIGRLHASFLLSLPAQPPAFLSVRNAKRRSHETAILCKSINGASTRSLLLFSRSSKVRYWLINIHHAPLYTVPRRFVPPSPRPFRQIHRCSRVVKIMNFLIRRNSLLVTLTIFATA